MPENYVTCDLCENCRRHYHIRMLLIASLQLSCFPESSCTSCGCLLWHLYCCCRKILHFHPQAWDTCAYYRLSDTNCIAVINLNCAAFTELWWLIYLRNLYFTVFWLSVVFIGCRLAVDLVVCVALGCDMFDCVFPTRTAVSVFLLMLLSLWNIYM